MEFGVTEDFIQAFTKVMENNGETRWEWRWKGGGVAYVKRKSHKIWGFLNLKIITVPRN